MNIGQYAASSTGELVQQYQTIEVSVEEGVTIVRFTKKCLLSKHVGNLAYDLGQLEATHSAKIVIDLSQMQSLISSVTNQLVRLKMNVDKHKGVLRLAGLQPVVREILTRLRLDKYFGIDNSEEEAIAALAEQRA